jgi:hypothetical protein
MTSTTSRFTRLLLPSVALASLVACSAEVEGPSQDEQHDAGREYGQVIMDTIGSRATVDEMEALCGQGAREEGIVPDDLDAFVEGCREAVTEE